LNLNGSGRRVTGGLDTGFDMGMQIKRFETH
jgi:hypothetical protein